MPVIRNTATMRSYEDGCAAARTLDLIGERCTLLVVRELLLGPKRFTGLRAGFESLRAYGVGSGAATGHRTSRTRWGARSPSKLRDAVLDVDSLILSSQTTFDPLAAEDLTAGYELRLGEDRYRAEVADGRFEVERGSVVRPDAIVQADSATLAGLVYEGRDLADALRPGRCGSRATDRRWSASYASSPCPSPPSAVGA